MSIESIDASIEDGSPIHLFEFLYETQYYRFTNQPANIAITALGNTWTSKNIGFSEITLNEDINANNLELTFPRSDAFANQFLTDGQNAITSLTLYRGYEGDNDWISYWKGRVVSAQITSQEITLACESVYTSLRRPGLRGKFGKNCNNTVYFGKCNIDPNDSSSDAIWTEQLITDISEDGLTLTIPGAASYPDNDFLGGMLRTNDGVYRVITSHVGSTIVINRAHDNLLSSDLARLYPGCNRTMERCSSRFNNLNNFFGAPRTPNENPFGGSRLS